MSLLFSRTFFLFWTVLQQNTTLLETYNQNTCKYAIQKEGKHYGWRWPMFKYKGLISLKYNEIINVCFLLAKEISYTHSYFSTSFKITERIPSRISVNESVDYKNDVNCKATHAQDNFEKCLEIILTFPIRKPQRCTVMRLRNLSLFFSL